MIKIGVYLTYVILLVVYIFFIKTKKAFISQKNKSLNFPQYNTQYKSDWFYLKNENSICSPYIYLNKKCFMKRKYNIIKTHNFSTNDNHLNISEYLNTILKHLENIKEKYKNERKGEEREEREREEREGKEKKEKKEKDIIEDNDFLYFLKKKENLKNIKFTRKSRKQYGYINNKIKDFIEEHNLKMDERIFSCINKKKNDKKENCSEDNKKKNLYHNAITTNTANTSTASNSSNNTNTSNNTDDSILCLEAEKEIKKGEVIIDISNKHIILFDKILEELKIYIDNFEKQYNTNYITYILKNKKETEIKKLDSLILLKYDIFKKHKMFLNFINTPNIYLTFWDIKLTLIVTYIYFISKYINLLLHFFHFNNIVFASLTKCINDYKKTIVSESEHITGHNNFQKREMTKKKTNIMYNPYHINQMELEIKKNTEEQLKSQKHFFFYKNYDIYINYIIHKKKFTHLPLNFSDSSFDLLNNYNIQNIIFFRKKMIHEIIHLYKDDLENRFLEIDINFIKQILFTNNKYYNDFQKVQKDSSFKYFMKDVHIEETFEHDTTNIQTLYQNILLCYRNDEKKKETEERKEAIEKTEQIKEAIEKTEQIKEIQKLQEKNETIKHIVFSLLYYGSSLKSLEELLNYNLLLHIYAYVSSHAIKIERIVDKVNEYKQTKEGDIEKQQYKFDKQPKEKKNETREVDIESTIFKEHILNSSVGIKHKQKRKEEDIDESNLLNKYNFNEYEKREKIKDTSKYMCLIPFIDICNHSNFHQNVIIQKRWNKKKEKQIEESINDNETKEKIHEHQSDMKSKDIYNTNFSMQLISTKEIKKGKEILLNYATMSNDLFFLEYGFINNDNTKVYFYFDINIIREIIIQIISFDKLPLAMLETLPKIKAQLLQKLGLISEHENIYERFHDNSNKQQKAKEIISKNKLLKEYLRKNKYINEYNIFTIKDHINKFIINEKVSFEKIKKIYLYIGGKEVIDPILLAAIRIIIFDDLNYLSKKKLDDLLKWDNYLSVPSEIIVIEILKKICDEIIYQNFFDINYEHILKQGEIKYSQMQFLQKKKFQTHPYCSEEKTINICDHNNFNIVMYNIIKLKSIQKAKKILTNRVQELKKTLQKI